MSRGARGHGGVPSVVESKFRQPDHVTVTHTKGGLLMTVKSWVVWSLVFVILILLIGVWNFVTTFRPR
jgi:uncharacterized membrane protein YdbT with pleckstrin-like domain